MAKKKSSWTPFLVVGGIVAALGLFVFFSGSTSAQIDASQYNYTDAQVEDEANITITEYGDFQCPACGQFHPVLKAIKQDYVVDVDYKHFPLSQIHPYAQTAAEASECARDQNRFWAYHDVLYENQDRLAKTYLYDYAEALGLDMQRFRTCLDNREKQVLVTQDYQDGVQAGVTGTPTVFVNGEKVETRSYAALAAQLNELGAQSE